MCRLSTNTTPFIQIWASVDFSTDIPETYLPWIPRDNCTVLESSQEHRFSSGVSDASVKNKEDSKI